jgi:Flp pilus assembly protein TadD
MEKEKAVGWQLALKKNLAQKMAERGEWYARHNALGFAKECFARAHELNPQDPRYFMELGWAIYRDQPARAGEAIAYLHNALRINPRLDQAHYYLGVIYKRAGLDQDADTAFRAALDLNPAHDSARRELAFLTQRQKQSSVWKKIFGNK